MSVGDFLTVWSSVAPALNPSTQGAEAVDFYEFKDSLIYIASSRSAKVK